MLTTEKLDPIFITTLLYCIPPTITESMVRTFVVGLYADVALANVDKNKIRGFKSEVQHPLAAWCS